MIRKINNLLEFFFVYNVFVFVFYINTSIIVLYKIGGNTPLHDVRTLEIILGNIFLILGTYTFNKISDRNEDLINGSNYFSFKHKNIEKVSFFSFIMSLALYVMTQEKYILISWIILATLSIFYSWPKKYRLKNIFLLKNIISAFCWAFSLSILLRVGNNLLPSILIVQSLIPIFLFVLLVEILWDIPDMRGDRIEHIHTLPTTFGFKITKIIILIFVTILFLKTSVLINRIVSLVLISFILNIKETTPKKIYHYFIFSLTILLFFLYFLFTI